jgi:tripartite-type tricarboxylate transporter receptor subunit TctC
MRIRLAISIAALTLAGVMLAVLPGRPAWSQSAKTIRVILTVPPGGSIDHLFRVLAEQIGNTRGQTVLIESRPGGGGVIAAEAVARAEPDGSTLLSNNNGTIINALLRKVHYDPIASFEPICSLVSTPQMIVVNGASSYHTLAELLDAARARPGELSIASVGPNTTQHIAIERLKRLARANLIYVPYPGGGPTVNAVLGAHVTAGVLNWSEIGEQVSAGKVRALATMARQRILPLPDLPTVAESGFPDFETDVWFGVTAPARTPKDTVSQLIDWFRTALLAPEITSKLTTLALYPNARCGAEFGAQLRHQSDLFAQLIRELNFKPE